MSRYIVAKNTPKKKNACDETDPLPKKPRTLFTFFRLRRKKVRHTSNVGRQAAPRLRVVMKKTEFMGEMCARATFRHLFYALVGSPF